MFFPAVHALSHSALRSPSAAPKTGHTSCSLWTLKCVPSPELSLVPYSIYTATVPSAELLGDVEAHGSEAWGGVGALRRSK